MCFVPRVLVTRGARGQSENEGEVAEVSGVRVCEIRIGGTFTFTSAVLVFVWGLGFGVWGFGFGVWGWGPSAMELV